jgi:hypothetical protein
MNRGYWTCRFLASGRLFARAGPFACLFAGVLALAGCGEHSQKGKQLDITLRTVSGSGTGLTLPAHFPHARYTFFTYEDPAGCVLGVRLLDMQGHIIGGDATDEPAPPGVSPESFRPAPVQKDVRDGDYRVHVRATTLRCHWAVDEVLNSMSSSDAPPSPTAAPRAPVLDAHVDNRSASVIIDVPSEGIYDVTYQFSSPSTAICQYSLGFRSVVGDFEPIAVVPPMPLEPIGVPPGVRTAIPYSPAPVTNVDEGGGGPIYLVSGVREVTVETTCARPTWRLSVKPWIGSLGGGTQGFRSARSLISGSSLTMLEKNSVPGNARGD